MAVGIKIRTERRSDSAEHPGCCWTLVCLITRFWGEESGRFSGCQKFPERLYLVSFKFKYRSRK